MKVQPRQAGSTVASAEAAQRPRPARQQRGPAFLSIVAANGVLGSQFDTFDLLTGMLSVLFWFSLGLWCVLVYGFLSTVTVGTPKPDLTRGLNGAWLLLVVATESLALLSGSLAQRLGSPSRCWRGH